MINIIWKFELEIVDRQFLQMPKGAQILSINYQNDTPCLWAFVDPEAPIEERCFEIFGTGEGIYEDMGIVRHFISTFQALDGAFVWHCFERL